MENCIFCNPDFRKGAAYLENDFFYAFFDNYPVSPGHTVIVPKRHVVDFSTLTEAEWQNLRHTIRETIEMIETTNLKSIYEDTKKKNISENSVKFCDEILHHPRLGSKPDAYNHGFNDGTAAGRTVDHLHWHVIPRFDGDVDDPRGGVRFVIPKMGNYKIPR
jgi:diadenosine tetraphosphate (Ap4A) HIT family hydrolase